MTVRRYRRYERRIPLQLGAQVESPWCSRNPTAGLVLAPEVERQRFLTPEETQRLVAAIKADENRIAGQAITFLLLTGARKSEVTKAKTAVRGLGKADAAGPRGEVGTTKDDCAERRSYRTAAFNRAHPRQSLDVPLPRDGTTLHAAGLRVGRIRRRAGLPDVRLHDLRHSYASFLVNQGVSLFVVQQLLGHSQSRTTQRHAHLAPKTLLDAAEIVGTVVRGSGIATEHSTAAAAFGREPGSPCPEGTPGARARRHEPPTRAECTLPPKPFGPR
jgi:integrase